MNATVSASRLWCSNHFVFDAASDGIQTKAVYNDYHNYCQSNGYAPLGESNFGKEVLRVFRHAKKTRPRIDGHRVSVYKGLKKRGDIEIDTGDWWTRP